MSVRLPMFTINDAQPAPTANTYGFRFPADGGNPKTVTLTNLQPGHEITIGFIATDITLPPGKPQQIVAIGDTIVVRSSSTTGNWVTTITFTVTAPTMVLTLLGFNTVALRTRDSGSSDRVYLRDESLLPASPKPADVLALHALLPVPGIEAFRLGQSRLGRDALTAARVPPDLFELGASKLGTRKLYYAEALKTWQDILPPCTRVETSRGVDADGAIRKARAGTLTATALDALDPRVTGMHRGTPVALIHWPTRTRIFTGRVTDLKVTPHRPGSRRSFAVEITAADAVAELVGITRHGARAETPNGQEPWTDRIARLARSAPDQTWNVLLPDVTPMAPTVWETSLAKHLDGAVASVAGWWTAEADGTVTIASGLVPPDDSEWSFTDAQDTDLEARVWSYTDADARWQASALITAITTTNHSAALDDGRWTADDLEVTDEDESGAWAYGGSHAAVDTTLAQPATIAPLLRRLLRASTANPPPARIALAAAAKRGPRDRAAHMSAAASLAPMGTADVTSRGETTQALIASVAHVITPHTWTTDLDLTTP